MGGKTAITVRYETERRTLNQQTSKRLKGTVIDGIGVCNMASICWVKHLFLSKKVEP